MIPSGALPENSEFLGKDQFPKMPEPCRPSMRGQRGSFRVGGDSHMTILHLTHINELNKLISWLNDSRSSFRILNIATSSVQLVCDACPSPSGCGRRSSKPEGANPAARSRPKWKSFERRRAWSFPPPISTECSKRSSRVTDWACHRDLCRLEHSHVSGGRHPSS